MEEDNSTNLVTTVSFGWGTAVLPKIPFSTAMQRPTITSSLTFSIMAALWPATRASSTGDCVMLQNRKSSPGDGKEEERS